MDIWQFVCQWTRVRSNILVNIEGIYFLAQSTQIQITKTHTKFAHGGLLLEPDISDCNSLACQMMALAVEKFQTY